MSVRGMPLLQSSSQVTALDKRSGMEYLTPDATEALLQKTRQMRAVANAAKELVRFVDGKDAVDASPSARAKRLAERERATKLASLERQLRTAIKTWEG